MLRATLDRRSRRAAYLDRLLLEPGSLIFLVGIPLCSVEFELADAEADDPEALSGATEACLDLFKYLLTKLSLSSRILRYLNL